MASIFVTLNQLPVAEFTRTAGPLFEHSPWIAERAAARRPFASIEVMHRELLAVVAAATTEEQIALIAAHPDLAGRLAVAGELTAHSQAEQRTARLDQLTPEQFIRMTELNDRYRSRFGFPFVICVRDHSQAEIFDEFERRLANDRPAEIAAALAQIGRIAWHRLVALLEPAQNHATPTCMTPKPGRITTHVLDTNRGRPAAGLTVSLWRRDGEAWTRLAESVTNADGRLAAPLVEGAALSAGVFELRFQVGAYFFGQGLDTGSPPYLDEVPVRFGLSNPAEPVHVPLLITPWSYSTYRGS